jgi:pilus assembly protein CpaD
MTGPRIAIDLARGYCTMATRGVALAMFAAALVGCQTDREVVSGTSSYTGDYRIRHPIAIKEGERTLEVFIGTARGGLNPTQRAEVAAFAGTWRNEATGGFIIDVPTGTPNERAAHEAAREIRSLLAAAGVGSNAIVQGDYMPVDKRRLATVRVRYPRMTAQTGPCGLWPKDLGITFNADYQENWNYWNLGCAHQRALAAMVENPADLVQPRAAEGPIYTVRRAVVVEHYKKGEDPSSVYRNTTKGTISDVGR